MPRAIGAAVAIAVALLLSACGSYVETTVTAHHNLPTNAAGKRFVMVPYPDQENSLEWASFSDLVARQLEAKGLVRADRPQGADLAVFITYAIDKGRTSVSAVPMYGQTSSGRTSTTTGYVGMTPISATTYTPPTYGITGYTPVKDTVYGRALKIIILDVPASVAQNKGVPVYEATATSAGASGTLNVVMPAIVAGAFKDWPGPSGKTRSVQSPLTGD